jgi:Tol biopolymer transport system component
MSKKVWLLIMASAATQAVKGQTIEIVTLSSTGAQSIGDCEWPSISADGRFVCFFSSAANLVPGDTNGVEDVFVRDRLSGTTERVSVSTAGVEGSRPGLYPSISADGRFVSFASFSPNLVPGDTNSTADIFVHDRLLGTTERVSVGSGGVEANGGSEYLSSISADGRFVAFSCYATNLVPGDTNGVRDVFIHDRLSGTTERVSVATGGAQGSLGSRDSSVSADGRFVAFGSDAPNLVVSDNNFSTDVFVRDLLLGTTERVSVATSGAEGVGSLPSISGDGRFVSFLGGGPNLVVGDTNGFDDIFLRDRLHGTTERVSVATGGAQGNGLCYPRSAVSDDGRFVTFQSQASNMVAGDTTGGVDIFVRDRLAATTERLSGSSQFTDSYNPAISADGRFVTFRSFASDLVPGDTNGSADIFVSYLGPLALVPFCSGDGSGSTCPCANSSTSGRGCANSTGIGGALAGFGAASLAADTLTLVASDITGQALFFQGTSPVGGGAGNVFGDGLRCAGGSTIRMGTVSPSGTSAQYPGSVTPHPIHIAGAPIVAGDVRHYQCWYRDAAVFCTASTYNLTNGVTTVWQP